MPPRKRKTTVDDDEASPAPTSQVAQPIKAETAESLATNLCRFVLLREHTHKPIARAEIKDAVMPEHKAHDRTGRILKQVLAVANEKLINIAGLELVSEADASASDDPGDDGDGAGASQTQAAHAPTASSGRGVGGGVASAMRYVLVNRLPEAVAVPLHETDEAKAIYLAFVEVVIAIIAESQDKSASQPEWIKEEDLFGWLMKLGLERESKLPQPAEQVMERIERAASQRHLHRRRVAAAGDAAPSRCGFLSPALPRRKRSRPSCRRSWSPRPISDARSKRTRRTRTSTSSAHVPCSTVTRSARQSSSMRSRRTLEDGFRRIEPLTYYDCPTGSAKRSRLEKCATQRCSRASRCALVHRKFVSATVVQRLNPGSE